MGIMGKLREFGRFIFGTRDEWHRNLRIIMGPANYASVHREKHAENLSKQQKTKEHISEYAAEAEKAAEQAEMVEESEKKAVALLGTKLFMRLNEVLAPCGITLMQLSESDLKNLRSGKSVTLDSGHVLTRVKEIQGYGIRMVQPVKQDSAVSQSEM